MQSFLLKNKSKKSFLEGISALKYSTRENYQAAINKFEQFSKEQFKGRTTDKIISELKKIPESQRDMAFIDLVQDFVNWLLKIPLANTTINQYSQIITYYFSYHGIRVHQIDIRQNVKKPKKIKEKLHPISKEEILQIYHNSIPKRKMLYLTLISSGMRIQECVALKRKDFDLSCKRIRIEIPAQFTKTQITHTTFVSREAELFLKPHLKYLELNDLVFVTNPNPFHAKMTEIEAFARTREKIGLTEKYQSTNRHKISLHSFRSFFFTHARRVHDTDIAHAMVGHSTYLDMYDRKDDAEKLKLYLKVEPIIRILKIKERKFGYF